MENQTNQDENYDSSVDQNDQSTTEITGYSTLSGESFGYCRTNSEGSGFSEPTEENSCSDEPSPSHAKGVLNRVETKEQKRSMEDKSEPSNSVAELEMMKERFSKLLLGEDMSGSGKGVCTAVTISNSITNLYATVFGQNLRLEPLKPEKTSMWKREMDCLLSVCDYIVEFIPSSQNLEDEIEVMTNRPRTDICINLPALQKLDTMLMEILESFKESEFWYIEAGNLPATSTRSGSFRRSFQRKEEKWWLPVPCVPPTGLSEKARKQLRHKRDCANQIHKAAMAINSSILAEMEIPHSYLASLPKSGKASVGDFIYRYMNSAEKFSPDHLLDYLNLTSEHEALQIADKVEASMYTWRRKACMGHAKSSWAMVKDLMSDTDRNDKNHILAGRAETLLFCLKQRYPELSQTTLDTCKIQYNRDVGQAILESYSRVLEGLAFNIVSWIEDVLFVDKSMKAQD